MSRTAADDVEALEVVLTSGCNLRCAYCYQNAKGGRAMGWPTLRAAVDVLVQSTSRDRELSFSGGEPLLRFDLIRRAVAHANRPRSRGGIRCGLTTNGTLLDGAVAEFVIEHDFRVSISFDGVPAAQAARGPGAFRKVERTLARLRRLDPVFFRDEVTVNMAVTSANLSHLAASVSYFLEQGVQSIRMSSLLTHDAGWRPEMIRDLDRQFERVFRLCFAHRADTGESPVELLRRSEPPEDARPRSGAMCGAGSGRTLCVDVDGAAYGCPLCIPSYQVFGSDLLRSQAARMRVCGIGDRDFPDRLARFPGAARGAAMFQRREAKRSSFGACRDCRWFDRCTVCPITIGHIPGNEDPHRIPDHACAFQKVALKWRERFPARPDVVGMLVGRTPLPPALRRVDAAARALSQAHG